MSNEPWPGLLIKFKVSRPHSGDELRFAYRETMNPHYWIVTRRGDYLDWGEMQEAYEAIQAGEWEVIEHVTEVTFGGYNSGTM